MSFNSDRKLLATKNCADATYMQLSHYQISPIPDSISKEPHTNKENSLQKLDKKFADMKRKQRHMVFNGSPKTKQSKINTLLYNSNSLPSTPIQSGNTNTLAIEEHHTSLSPSFLSSSRKLKIAKISKFSPLKRTLSSFLSNSNCSSKFGKSGISEMIQDIQIINNKESSPLHNQNAENKETNTINVVGTNSSPLNATSQTPAYSLNIGYNTDIERNLPELLSSPLTTTFIPRLKKQVAFSSDVESEPFSSSPIKGVTPRSILKVSDADLFDNFLSLEEVLKQDLTKNESWQHGFVLQIPPDHPNLTKILATLGAALENKNFTKQYEVYATLNHLIKSNPKILSSYTFLTRDVLKSIVSTVKDGLTQLTHTLQNGSNAFKLRASSQGLKLVSLLNLSIMLMPDISTIYDVVLELMKNEFISKGLAISILQFIKVLPEGLYPKMEALSVGLIQMKYFPSASISAEKLNILKRFIVLQPALLSKCGYQLFSYVLYSIMNTDVPAYSKVLNSAISILTCSARNGESKVVLYKLLSEKLKSSFSSLKSNVETGLKSWMTIGQALCITLKYLIHLQFYPQTAKTWSYLVYMVSYNRKDFSLEKWDIFRCFMDVFQTLYLKPRGAAFMIEAWKSVVYNFQTACIKDWSADQLKEKLDSVLLPFEFIQLPINNELVNQWTVHQGYVILYCRLAYSMRLHMEMTHNEEHHALLLEAMLKPFAFLKEIDATATIIMKTIFTSTRHIYNEPADHCFWLSDVEKWKSRISSIPKTLVRNKIVFSIVIKLAWQLFKTSLNLVTHFVNLCIHASLDNLKLTFPHKEYCATTVMAADLILELIENIDLQSVKIEEAFGLLEKADSNLIYSKKNHDDEYFLVKLFNKIKRKRNKVLPKLVSLCKSNFDSPKFALICLLSDNIHTTDFPNYEYDSDLCECFEQEKIKLSAKEEEIIIKNLQLLLENPDFFQENYTRFVQFLELSKFLMCLNPISRFELFQSIIENETTQQNITFFYLVTPDSILELILELFTNDNDDANYGQKLANFLFYFTNLDAIPPSWIAIIGNKLTHLIHPELTFDSSLVESIYFVLSKLPINTLNRFKKMAKKRKLTGLAASSLFCNKQSDTVKSSIDESFEKSRTTYCVADIQTQEIDDDTIVIDTDLKETSEIVFINVEDEVNLMPVADMKSFIIGRMKDNEKAASVESPFSPQKAVSILNDVQVSPAKRTRSRHTYTDEFTLDEWDIVRKKRKRERKRDMQERRERKIREDVRNRSVESEAESSEVDLPIHNNQLDSSENESTVSDLPNPDLIQLRVLLKRLNAADFNLRKETKKDLEKDLITMLTKLKQTNY